MVTRIQVRRDTAANWTANDPVLYVGEPGLETDTGKIKYGDGTSPWTSLVYSFGTPGATGLGATGATGYPGATGYGGSTGYQGATGAGGGNVPIGGIIIWSGASSAIPTNWHLCDGTNSTPDLRDKFVVGAGSTYSVGGTGGSANAVVVSHSHGVTDSGHSHNINLQEFGGSSWQTDSIARSNTNAAVFTVASESQTTGISVNSAGVSGTGANLPPYYALCYIMRTA